MEQESFIWLNRMLSGEMTSLEAQALERWRAADPAHEHAFGDAVRFRSFVRGAVRAQRAQASDTRSPKVEPRISRRAFLGGTALAASAAAYVIARPPGHMWSSWRELTADYRTGTGERRALEIAPGVKIELNTQTNIDLPGGRDSGAIELISGELAIAANRPGADAFSVHAQNAHTLVSAARANFRHDDSAVYVTCVAGSLEIEHPVRRVRLPAGRQLAYTASTIHEPVAVDINIATAWRRGLLIFRNSPLRYVVSELNRYRPGRIILLHETLAQRSVYGVFELEHIDRALEQVRALTGATVRILPGGLALLG